jgi:hypothetical protein
MNEAERTGGLAEQNLPGGIVLFIIKTCIVAVAISACTILVANSVIESVEASAARTISNLREVPIGGRQFWAKMEQALDHAAEPSSDLSSEKKAKLIKDVRVIIARWRPFVDAVQTELQAPGGKN